MKTAIGLAAIVAALYGPSLSFDFMQDDYFLLRPWSAAELASVFHGPYDPTGREPVFYRPLCSVWYAAMFWLFGVNATALHAVSLAIVFALSLVARNVITRESGSPRVGLAGGVLLIVHPALAASSVVWATSQHVFLGMLCAFGALRVWQWCRHGPNRRWLALVPVVTAGMLLREDVVMVVPAMLAAQFARSRIVGDVAAPRRRLVAAAAVALLAAFVARYVLLGGLGGYGFMPTFAELALNWQRGPRHALLTPVADVPGHLAASAIISTMFIAGSLQLWRRGAPGARSLWVLGMLLLACANLPLFQWATPMRFGLMTSLAVLALAPAAVALGEWLLARGGRGITAAAALAALLGLAWTSRHAYQEWWTCDSPDVESRLAGEPQTTPDIARFLRSVEARCAAGAFVRLNDFAPVLAWGPDEPDAAGVTHVMGRTATWLIARQAAGVRFAVRAPAPIPSMARFRSASGEVAVVRLDAAGWQDVELALDDTLLTRLRGRHRVDLVAETAVEVRVQGQVSAPMAGDTSPIPRSRPR